MLSFQVNTLFKDPEVVSFLQCFHGNRTKLITDLLKQSISTGEIFDIINQTKNGKYFPENDAPVDPRNINTQNTHVAQRAATSASIPQTKEINVRKIPPREQHGSGITMSSEKSEFDI